MPSILEEVLAGVVYEDPATWRVSVGLFVAHIKEIMSTVPADDKDAVETFCRNVLMLSEAKVRLEDNAEHLRIDPNKNHFWQEVEPALIDLHTFARALSENFELPDFERRWQLHLIDAGLSHEEPEEAEEL